MKTKKLLLNALPLLFIGTAMLYAAAPSGGYLPGNTNDPACAPGDTDCFVQLPADSDDQTLSLSGSDLAIQDGNSVDLSGLAGMDVFTQSGTTAYYNDGNVGIGILTPSVKLDIEGGLSVGVGPYQAPTTKGVHMRYVEGGSTSRGELLSYDYTGSGVKELDIV